MEQPSRPQVLLDLHGDSKNGPSGSLWKQKCLYCPVGSLKLCEVNMSE